MSSTFTDAAHPEGLLRLMEAAPLVHRRHQFFVWTQGDLQRWLPHDLLLCGFYNRDTKALVFDVFNSRPLGDGVVAQLQDASAPWAQALTAAWSAARQQSVAVSLDAHATHSEVLSMLMAGGYDEVLVHGHTRPGRADEIESLFVLARQGSHVSAAQVAALDMLLPCLHAAYQRVCVTERQMDPGTRTMPVVLPMPQQARVAPITLREREILMWVRDGLSNQQIGLKLGISALTVKNHVQKILRKLGASNRAQAVAKAMSQDMLSAPGLND